MAGAMSPLRRAHRRRRAVVLALVALLFLGSLFSGSAHWLMTPHRLCTVHGAVEHGPAGDHELTAARAPEGPAYSAEKGSHEDCPLGPWARTEVLPLPDLAREAVGPPSADTFVLRGRRDPIPDTVRFRLAPSRSPPQAIA